MGAGKAFRKKEGLPGRVHFAVEPKRAPQDGPQDGPEGAGRADRAPWAPRGVRGLERRER